MEYFKSLGALWLYPLARIMAGFLFFMHGAMKFSWLTDFTSVWSANPMMGVAGVFEVVIGLGLMLGIYVRLFSAIGIVEMLTAIGMVHRVLNPLAQGGWELPMLFICLFAVFLTFGARQWSVEKLWSKKEMF